MRIIRNTALLAGCFLSLAAFAENWPEWRGPSFNGSTTETNLPTSWSKTENVAWSMPLPDPSHATPIVWDDSVFVTSPDADENLLLLCVERKTGSVRWQKTVGIGNRVQGRNNMASPSPVTDGKTVWTLFGTGDLAAYDFSGRKLWARSLSKEYGRFNILWLYGSSPMLYKDRLYIQVLQRVPNESFVLCLDPATGTNIWRHIRPTDASGESEESYATPIPSECGGQTEIVVVGGDYVTGEDAATGEELWRGGGMRNFQHRSDSRLVPTPVVANGLVFVCGAKRNPFLAFHDCGQGDITTTGLAWTRAEYTTDCATPLFYQNTLFMLDGDKQLMVCVDPATGHPKWKQSLGVHDIFRASPTGADGKLYCFSEYGTAVVMSSADGSIISTIKMGEGTETDESGSHASIAAAQGSLFVRAAQHLYCIGKK